MKKNQWATGTTTIRARGSIYPLLFLIGGMTLVLGTSASWQRHGSSSTPTANSAVTVQIAGTDVQATCNLCESAIQRLRLGDTAGATPLLQQIAQTPLHLDCRDRGTQALESFSSGGLFMRLASTLEREAMKAIAAGRYSEAHEHLVCCRRMATQMLADPQPTLTSLQIMRYFDQRADKIEVALTAREKGEAAAHPLAAQAAYRQQQWHTQYLASAQKLRDTFGCFPQVGDELPLAALLAAKYDATVLGTSLVPPYRLSRKESPVAKRGGFPMSGPLSALHTLQGAAVATSPAAVLP